MQAMGSPHQSGAAHAGSNFAPRAQTAAHAGSNSAPRAQIAAHARNPAQTAAHARSRRPRGSTGGARAHRRKVSSTKGKRPAQCGVYGPKDFSAWGYTQDPRYQRPGAWQNVELPLAPELLRQCVLVVSDHLEELECETPPPDLLLLSPVGVLCTPTATEVMWWVDLLRCGHDSWQFEGWGSQGLRIKDLEQCNAAVHRECLVSGRSSKVGHRLPMGGGGVGFGSVAWGTSRVCQAKPGLLDAANVVLPIVMEQQVAVWSLFPKAYAALLSTNHSSGLLVADSHATHGQSPVAQHGVSHMHITSKGANLSSTRHGFSCHPHADRDNSLAVGAQSQFSLGVWWPIGAEFFDAGQSLQSWELCPTFGYNGGVVTLSRPVACAFNSAIPHASSTCLLPSGCDFIGTSTEVSSRDVQYRRKRPINGNNE